MEVEGAENIYQAPVAHADLKRFVQAFCDATATNALLAKRDRDYYDGDQISRAMLDELEKRGQPAIPVNKIKSAICGLLGLIDASASDPEAFPRNYSSQDAADVCTKTLRFVCDKADYKAVRRGASENFLIQGVGAAICGFERGKVTVERIRWEDLVYDPYAQELDFRDARYLGIAKMIDQDEVEAQFGDAYEKLGSPTGDFTDFFDSRKETWWVDPVRRRVRVVDLFYQAADQSWHRAIFVFGGMLWSGPSPYHDDEGSSICPIRATAFEMKQDGSRYGAARHMIPLQDEVNARRSRLLHLVNSRQTQQTDQFAPPENKEIARREASKADGTIPYGWEARPSPDLAQGQMLILQQAAADLDRMAPTPAVLGQDTGAGQSGRARQMLQMAGQTELARAFDRFAAFELGLFRTLWWIAREYLDQPTLVRITDDPRAPQFLSINEPVMGPVHVPVTDPQTGQPVVDPTTGQPHTTVGIGQVGTKNAIAQLDMDIVLTTVPDHVTLAQEVFETLMEYASSNRLTPFDPNFWAMIEMSTLPDKRDIIERLQRLKAEADQQAAPQQAAAAQAAMQKQQVDNQLGMAKAARDGAQAQKAQVEAIGIAHQMRLDHLAAMQPQAGPGFSPPN